MAFITVSSGQTVNGYDVINNFFDVELGGSVSATTVGSDGYLMIYTGGTATGTVVTGQGYEELFGGYDSNVTLDGGFLIEEAGSSVTGLTFNGGGFAAVSGSINGAVVSPGATFEVGNGGIATNTTIEAGAVADFNAIPFSANATATLNAATDVLTISGGGMTSTVQLAGSYAGETFSLSSDLGIDTFLSSTIGTEIAVSANPVTEVTNVYEAVLQRAPDAAGLAFWSNALGGGSVAPTGFNDAVATSQEAQANVVPIVDLYTILGRAPDQAGLQFWVQQHEAGTPLNAIARDFLASPEGQQVYGSPVVASAASDAAFVNTAYQEVLGRSADAGGFASWTGALQANAITPGAVLADLALSPEGQARDASAATNFLVAAANGTANYGGSLFPTG